MPYDIILGRDSADKQKFGKNGLIYIGKGYVKMGNYTSLSNKIYMDVARTHVVLVAGKRGSGKSYTLGVIAEELSNLQQETSQNIASIIFDTMGIFWTMKFKNEKDLSLLNSWDLKSKNLPIKVFVPIGKAEEYKEKNIPVDETFSIKPSELEAEDWISLFNLNITSLESTLIQRTIKELKEKVGQFSLLEMKVLSEHDKKANQNTKEILSSLILAADDWGIFSKDEKGTEISDLVIPGTTTILDTSVYSTTQAYNIRALVISLISKKIFKSRMDARKKEEINLIKSGNDYLTSNIKKEDPLVWIFIDEAHEFLPKDSVTPATETLKQILREGRQPGISLVLATQQPGEIHKDAMTQSDIVISHRVTSKPDIEALNNIMQTYLLENIQNQMNDLPQLKGSAIILDDNSERLYPIRIRPRFTWHGGEAPTAVGTEIKI